MERHIIQKAEEKKRFADSSITGEAMLAHPSKERLVHPSLERLLHPSLERLVHPSLERLLHPSLERLVHPSLERLWPVRHCAAPVLDERKREGKGGKCS